MTTKARKGATFTHAKSSSTPLAIRPSALSLFWLFGCGTDNEAKGRTMIVSVNGPLEQRASWWDGYDAVLERFRDACKDETTTSIALRLDSPGGECAGLNECVRLMLEAKEASGKRVVAYADESAYSAAYALACVADEIYLPPSGGVGSVGVIATCLSRVRMMQEIGIDVAVVHAGARKADCHPDLPLSEDALAVVQADVDALAVMFRELVASSRSLDVDDVAALEAGTFMGADAIAAGLADGVMGFSDLLAMLDGDEAGASDDDETETSGAAALTTETTIMGDKTKARGSAVQLAASVVSHDSLAKPQIASANPAELEAVVARLSGAATPAPGATAPAASEEGDDDEEDDEEEESAETSTETETTTTTTTSEGGDDEEDDDDDDDEEEEKAAARTPSPLAVIPAIPRNATSATVLATIKELTGESSPAAQIGALHALRDKAAKADELAKANRKATREAKAATLKSTVEGAIRAGKLEPGRRAWAMTQSVESINAYLKGGGVIAPRTPLRTKATKGPNRTEQPAAGEGVIDEAVANVAKAMQMDPAAVQAHANDLRKSGAIH